MDAASESVESSKQCADRNLPPLRLAHLLLYVAVASVYLAMAMSWRWNNSEDMRASDPRYWHIISTPPALWNAATTTVVILLVCWTFQRRDVLRQPGHWLALVYVWNPIGLYLDDPLFQLVRVLAGVGLKDDWSNFYPWASHIHGLRFLPPAIVFLCLALGWRKVADTWPWRLYFGMMGIWFVSGALRWSPFSFLAMYQSLKWGPRLLGVAVVNDFLPRRPRRHWSHWATAIQPLLAYNFSFVPPFLWDLLHSNR